jgi:uncharacterized membrane protein
MIGRTRRGLWWLLALLSVGLALFSYRYLLAIGPMSPDILRNLFARPWLDVHIAGAATALLLCPLQLLPSVRRRWPAIHRWIGRTYVVGCLVGGAGGLVVAFGSTAGPIATAGFASLAVVWLIANLQGWRYALARNFPRHRAWMIRSSALTFGAVTLRLYLPLFPVIGVDFMDGYRAVSFLSWIPNLVLAELYVRGMPLDRGWTLFARVDTARRAS